jgi:hypothetical protein
MFCLAGNTHTSAAPFYFIENFPTNIFTGGGWTRTDSSVSVDTVNGWLQIAADGANDDKAEKVVDIPLPVVVEGRTRLVSGGGGYTLPSFEFPFGPGGADHFGITSAGIWPYTLDVTTARPVPNENTWITFRAIFRQDGGQIYAKYDTDTQFYQGQSKTWTITNHISLIRFRQHWDSICDLDYLIIRPLALSDGLVAYYPFDGNANDASGNALHGSLSGATPVPDRFGQSSGALYFDGSNDYVEVSDNAVLHIQQLTLSAWVSPDTPLTGQKTVIDKDEFLNGWQICLQSIQPNQDYSWFGVARFPTWYVATNKIDFSAGKWYHVLGTYDGSAVRFFVNGILMSSSPCQGAIQYGTTAMEIGRNSYEPGNTSYYFKGKIDDVRIYNRALSSSEILQLYTMGGGATTNTSLSNMRAETNGAKTVRIWYDIAGAFQTIPVATMISTNDGQNYDLVGPSSAAVAPGNNRYLDWDASQQVPNQINSHVRVRAIAGPAVAETPQSFTVDTRDTGTRPTVQNVTSAYCSGSQHVSYLAGVPLNQDFTVTVNWNGKSPGTLHYLCPQQYNGLSYKQTFAIGSWSTGAKLSVIAEASDGTQSAPFLANFDVCNPPPGIPLAILYPVPAAGSLKYQSPEFSFNVLDSKAPLVSKDVPVFGDKKLGFLTAVKASAEVNGDGTATAVLSVGTGSKISMADFDITPAITGQADWSYASDKQQWIPSGYIGLAVEASWSSPPAYVCPMPPVYFRLDVDINSTTRFGIDGWDVTGSPMLGGNWEFSAEATGVLGCGASGFVAVEGYLGGGPTWTVQYPKQPALEELGVQLDGGVRVVMLFYTWDAGLLHYEWWFVQDTNKAARARYSAALAHALNAPNTSDFKLMSRDYVKASTPYSAFLAGRTVRPMLWGDPVVSRIPLTLQTNIFPYSEPALGASDTNRFLLFVTDNPARSAENRTELVWAKWNGSAWVNPTSVWNDATADFAPAVKVFPDSKALAVWQNERAVLADGATLDDALAGLEVAVGWFNPASNLWSCSNLTDNLTLDQGPKLDAAANGKALVTWISNPSNSPLGSVSAPNTIRSRFWDGAAWQNPGDIATNVGMLLWHTVAFDGTNGVMLATLDLDDDQSTITNQELYGATFDGTSWSSFTQLTTNSIQDTKPQAAFDSAGHLLVVWYQDTNLVMHTGDLNLSNPTVIGAVGGASSAKDFRLITGPAGQVTLLWEDVAADGTGPDPFVFNYDYALNSWSQPIRLLQNTNLLERSFAGAYSDTGSLLLAYNQVNVQMDTNGVPIFTNNAVDLMFMDYLIGGDLAVSPGSLMLSTNNPQPGQTVQLSVLVRNAGEKAATNIMVAFYNGDTLIGATQTVAFLAAGTSTNVTVDWTIPVGVTNTILSVIVDPDMVLDDRNWANNSASLVVMAPDLVITEMSVMNSARDRRMINARVVNQGNYACNAPFQVSFRRGAADGQVIGTVAVEAIPMGGQYDANLEWNMAGVTFTNAYETVYAVADSGAVVAESDRSNNTNSAQVATTLDSDNDGLSDAEELRYSTDPHNPDTDGDGLKDGQEVYQYSTSPTIADGVRLTATMLPDIDAFELKIDDVFDRGVVVQVSSNLVNWATITNFTALPGPIYFADPTTPRPPIRYYRVAIGQLLCLKTPMGLTNGNFIFKIENLSGRVIALQASTNLVDWETLTNFSEGQTRMLFNDPAATNYSQRFYRAVVP